MARPRPDACEILGRLGIKRGEDFHVLRSGVVERLLDEAQQHGYRKPKSANGSKGRYFHQYLQRLCTRERR